MGEAEQTDLVIIDLMTIDGKFVVMHHLLLMMHLVFHQVVMAKLKFFGSYSNGFKAIYLALKLFKHGFKSI